MRSADDPRRSAPAPYFHLVPPPDWRFALTGAPPPDEPVAAVEALLGFLGLGRGPLDGPVIRRLLAESLDLGSLAAVCGAEDRLPELAAILGRLARSGLLRLDTAAEDALVTLVPMAPEFGLDTSFESPRETRFRLSRFACFHHVPDEGLTAETPRGLCRVTIHRPEATAVLHRLADGASVDELVADVPGVDEAELELLLRLLVVAGLVQPCDADGTTREDRDPVLRQWDFHDLFFHSRSRMGRHDRRIGGTYRFRDEIPAPGALRSRPHDGPRTRLVRPDLHALAASEASLTAVLERRTSVRAHGFPCLDVLRLGEFLYRVARVKSHFENELGEFTSRPYPSGGASYELEIYVSASQCAGLRRGFYYYDPVAHELVLIREPDQEFELLLHDAWVASAQTCHPQILLTFASRFQRVSWKYEGMAYATQLKNVGVLYAVMYLVATSMGLAPCALGLGNTDRFCRLSGTDFFQEGSIGEFMLGSNPSAV